MNILDVLLIGVALAMDAFALTIANCTAFKTSLTRKKEWSMPLCFGLFQFLMPIIGYYIGSTFSESLSNYSKYLTAIVFFSLSAKIVLDNLKGDSEDSAKKPDSATAFTIPLLIFQGVITSIDALFIGVAFSIELEMSIFIASMIIGVITFIIVALALVIGKTLGKALGKYAEWAGAVILFALAIKSIII